MKVGDKGTDVKVRFLFFSGQWNYWDGGEFAQ